MNRDDRPIFFEKLPSKSKNRLNVF